MQSNDCVVLLQIRNVWEILSGQHRTNAGDKFFNGVKAVETEWAAVLGKTLCPIFYRKMPQRLAKRLSAGFQIKESQPQVCTAFNVKYELPHVCLKVAVTKCCKVHFFGRMKFGASLS